MKQICIMLLLMLYGLPIISSKKPDIKDSIAVDSAQGLLGLDLPQERIDARSCFVRNEAKLYTPYKWQDEKLTVIDGTRVVRPLFKEIEYGTCVETEILYTSAVKKNDGTYEQDSDAMPGRDGIPGRAQNTHALGAMRRVFEEQQNKNSYFLSLDSFKEKGNGLSPMTLRVTKVEPVEGFPSENAQFAALELHFPHENRTRYHTFLGLCLGATMYGSMYQGMYSWKAKGLYTHQHCMTVNNKPKDKVLGHGLYTAGATILGLATVAAICGIAKLYTLFR